MIKTSTIPDFNDNKNDIKNSCLMSPQMQSIRKHLLVIAGSVIGNILYSSYKMFSEIVSITELAMMFDKGNCLVTTHKVLQETYLELTKHLALSIGTGEPTHIYKLVNKVMEKYEVFVEKLSYAYILNVAMWLGIKILSKISFNTSRGLKINEPESLEQYHFARFTMASLLKGKSGICKDDLPNASKHKLSLSSSSSFHIGILSSQSSRLITSSN